MDEMTSRTALPGRLGRPEKAVPRTKTRHGVASLDYVLVGGVVLPMAAFVLWIGPRIIQQVYDMLAVQIGWPFM
jgi:hypothetical protein